MAFTDPIVAGNSLVRKAIQSDNYVPGGAGWSIFRNGSAEFDALTLRDGLNVPGITLNGVDLATTLNTRALGCVAWMRGYPTTSTTTQDAIMWTEVDVVAGRLYEVSLMNITPDIANVKQCEFQIRYVTGTSTWPTNASPTLAITLRLSQFEMGFIRAYYLATVNTRLRLRASIVSLDGNTVRCWAPGDGCVLAVNDLGVAVPQNGSASNVQPGKTLKDWTITATTSRNYNGNGTWRNDPLYNDKCIQGDFLNGRGNQRAWWGFNATDLAQINDVVGVPLSDIVVAECMVDAVYWQNGNGQLTLGYHPHSGATITSVSTEPTGGFYNQLNVVYGGVGAGWFDLPTVMRQSMSDNYLRGFLIGNAGGTNPLYAGIMQGAGSNNPPKLHMTYYK